MAALVAAVVALDLAQPVQAQSEEQNGRIVARRLDDGRTEFGWQPVGGERVLPRARYFPAGAGVGRWLNSSPVEVDSVEIGRINARLGEDGRIEFAFTPTDGERILPPSRYFPADVRVGRWLRSTEIAIGAVAADGFTAVSVGGYHACAIRAGSGEIECWGDNSFGQTDAPPGRFAAVSASGRSASSPGVYTCGLRESGEIECWGADSSKSGSVFNFDRGQTDAPPGPFTAVSAGSEHACGLRTNGAIECWGTPLNDFGQADAPAGRFIAVSAYRHHTCGLRESGAIECSPDWSQADAPDDPYIALIDGASCGLRESGATDCVPSDAQPGPFSAVSTGWAHTCAIRAGSGKIECWGSNSVFEWNEETETGKEVYGGQLDAPPGRFTAISAGVDYTCAIRDTGAIECWGYNELGQTDAPDP